MPRSRWLKFSLRSLLILVMLAGLASAAAVKWVDYGHRFERQQRFCDQLIHDLGGTRTLWIERDVPVRGFRCGTYSRPEGLEFVVDRRTTGLARLYSGGLREVAEVYVSYAPWNAKRGSSEKRADIIRRVASLDSLREIHLNVEYITADELAPLAALTELKKVTLHTLDPESADAALALLGRFPALEELSIDLGNWLLHDIRSQEQIEALSRLVSADNGPVKVRAIPAGDEDDEEVEPGAENLDAWLKNYDPTVQRYVSTRGITAKGLAELGRSSSLQKLELRNAVLLDDGLKALASLRELTLQCRIASAGYAGLAACNQLRALHISFADFESAGAAAIGSLPKLQELVANGPMNDAMLRNLQIALHRSLAFVEL